MAAESEAAALPMRAVLRAQDVVAAGRVNNVLQVPSPIYTAEFTDAHHVLIGAGGGGRKFGMANIALLLRVQSLRSSQGSSSGGLKNTAGLNPQAANQQRLASSSAANSLGATSTEPSVWSFAAAIDLGVDIPWCTSAFLPFHAVAAPDGNRAGGSATDPDALHWSEKQRRVLQGLVGFIALSSISAFTLIGLYAGAEPTTSSAAPRSETAQEAGNTADGSRQSSHQQPHPEERYLRQLARITVPHDEKDPDKKPIALSQNVLFVAHDANGIFGYALTDLVPDSFEDEDEGGEAAYCARYSEQVKGDGALQLRVPRVVTNANHVVEWQLPARVNDLSVNRVCMVQAEKVDAAGAAAAAVAAPPALPNGPTNSSALQPCKAHLHEHLVVAAVLQNKTVALSSLRLRRKYGVRAKDAQRRQQQPGEKASDNVVIIASCMQTLLTLTGSQLPLPFKLLTSSLRLVRLFGWNNIDAAQQAEMRRRLTWQSLEENGAATHGPLCSLLLVAFNTHASESYIIHGAVHAAALTSNKNSSSSGSELSLQVQWSQLKPTAVLGDAITSLSVCADKVPADYEARVRRSPVGAAVPTHFLAGTVEGWVASLRWDAVERRWRSDHVRPSPLKSVAKRFPALHKEPVSCVAVSAENDVVSADIAQNVALTTMPYATHVTASMAAEKSGSASSAAATSAKDDVAAELATYAVQPRVATASALFPTSLADTGLLGWLLAEVAGGAVPMRALIFLAVPALLLLVAIIIMMR